MTVRRTALALSAAAIVFAAVAGAASTLGLTNAGLGAGQAVVAPCGDTSGVTRTYSVSSGVVSSVNVSGFPATCVAANVKAEVVDKSGTVVASGGDSIASDGTVTIVLTPQPASSAVFRTHLAVSGP